MARECYVPAVFTAEIAEVSHIIDQKEHGHRENYLRRRCLCMRTRGPSAALRMRGFQVRSAGEVGGDGLGDGLAGSVLIEGKSRRGIDFETVPFPGRSLAEVDAGNRKIHSGGEPKAAVGDFAGQAGSFDGGGCTRTSGVAVVVGAGDDLAGKDLVTDHMHAVVGSENVLLKLRGAPANLLEALGVGRGEARYDAANAADGFVDHGAVLLPEYAGGIGIGGDESLGNRKTE